MNKNKTLPVVCVCMLCLLWKQGGERYHRSLLSRLKLFSTMSRQIITLFKCIFHRVHDLWITIHWQVVPGGRRNSVTREWRWSFRLNWRRKYAGLSSESLNIVLSIRSIHFPLPKMFSADLTNWNSINHLSFERVSRCCQTLFPPKQEQAPVTDGEPVGEEAIDHLVKKSYS